LTTYDVREVRLLPERLERLRGFELDFPPQGHRDRVHVLHVIGWVVGLDSRATHLEVVYGDQVLRTAPVRGIREDVASALDVDATDCVFHLLVGLIGLDREPTLHLRVALEDGTKVPAATIRLYRRPLQAHHRPSLRPLIVTSLGRSGSTWLMKMLAAHPEIVVFRRFPYESAPARYWLHMLRVLSDGANLDQSTHPNYFPMDLWSIGSNPYADDRVYEQPPLAEWLAGEYVERLAAFCQQTIDDWYGKLAEMQAQPDAIYFAEKHMWPDYLAPLTWELYPEAKELFLVRDFRDMALSILAFDRRRGYAGFGRPDGVTDEQYVRDGLGSMVRDLHEAWRARSPRAHLIRYEELLGDPHQILAAALRYLEVDSSPEAVREIVQHASAETLELPGASGESVEVTAHRTKDDPAATIGRWRTEADRAFLDASDSAFGEALETFGYSAG
jgi:hypothetical protein